MQELIHQPQQQNHAEESHQGISMAPPAFQLKASPIGKMEEEAQKEEGEQDGYEVNVANFARISLDISNAMDTQNIRGLINALEPLKHDRAQVAQFRDYFSSQFKISLEDHLITQWNERAAETAIEILGSFAGGKGQEDAETTLFKSIAEKNYREILSDLSCIADVEGASSRYRELNPGKDLYTDILALSHPQNGLAEYANKAFGKVQSCEKVDVQNEEEAKEAREITARVFNKYHVDINSQASLDVLREWAKDAPEELKESIKISNWTITDLRGIEQSLQKFAPFLGPGRFQTGLSDAPQEVQKIGKLNQAISYSKSEHFHESESIGGHYLEENQTAVLYDNMYDEGFVGRYNTNGKNSNSAAGNVMAHELAHGLLSKLLPKWPEVSNGYWRNQVEPNPTSTFTFFDGHKNLEFTKSAISGSEAPPTEYAATNPSEDLAESVTLYLNNPSQLLTGSPEWQKLLKTYRTHGIVGNACPRRFKILDHFFKKMESGAGK
jgi:hypothetical protein